MADTHVKDINPRRLIKHSEMMQSRAAFDKTMESAKLAGEAHDRKGYAEEVKEDVVRAHNISERLLRIMAEEHQMEKYNDRVLAIVLYNVVYGALASTTGLASLMRTSHFMDSVEQSIPGMAIEKLLEDVFGLKP